VVAQQSASPQARRLGHPSWLDLRFVTGILLVLVSVLLGAKVIATADRSVRVWAMTRDVSAGTTLAAEDLRPARVRLFDSAEIYLRVIQSPAGRAVTRPMRAGELLPRAAVVPSPPGAFVNIPVQPTNAPGLTRGGLIDVWSTVKGCAPVQVLSRVVVQDVHSGTGGALSASPASLQVIVRVSPDDARRVVAALGTESTIRLVVLAGDLPATTAPGLPVDGCRPTAGDRLPSRPASTTKLPAAPGAGPAPTPTGSSATSPTASATPTNGGR
jgi:hypothetical protein